MTVPDAIRKGAIEAAVEGVESDAGRLLVAVKANAALDFVSEQIEELTNNETHCTNCDSACAPFDDEPSEVFHWKDGSDES